ncbi:MAG: hypothetical protein NVS3B20_14940 [Polyangiales bacterium]
MLTPFDDYDHGFAVMDELRRRMERLMADYEANSGPLARGPLGSPSPSTAWPRINVFDAGATIVLRADVPGLSEKDLQISANQDGITIAGERRSECPEGYAVHRRERATAKFARSVAVPWKIDVDHTQATVKDGVLTITLTKAKEAQPRQITVRAT